MICGDNLPHPGPLPKERGETFAAFWECCATGSDGRLRISQRTDDSDPSPGGEGRDEGER